MGFNVGDNSLTMMLTRHLEEAQKKRTDALTKLSSGTVFTSGDPRPAERAISEGLDYKLKSLASSKRNINDGVSLLQTAEGSLSEISNMVTRMKEINVSASSTTLNDQERRFLFVEYQALHNEISRIAQTTTYNGMPLLNGDSPDAPEELILRIGDPTYDEDDNDLNVIRFDGLKKIVVTPEALGLKSAAELLGDSDEETGIDMDSVMDLMTPEDSDIFATTYDMAVNSISTQRAIFGAMQTRLNRAMDFTDVYQENLAAAKSRISDTDYAMETSNLAHSNILANAATAALAHANMNSSMVMNLINSVVSRF